MDEVIAQFEGELRRVALTAAREIVRHELERRASKTRKQRAVRAPDVRGARKARAVQGLTTRTPMLVEQQLELPMVLTNDHPDVPAFAVPREPPVTLSRRDSSAADNPVADAAMPVVGAEPAPMALSDQPAPAVAQLGSKPTRAPAPKRLRALWTRDGVIGELAGWMSERAQIDARFMRRHGPPGLVAATRREFGNFERGLEHAAQRVSERSQASGRY